MKLTGEAITCTRIFNTVKKNEG